MKGLVPGVIVEVYFWHNGRVTQPRTGLENSKNNYCAKYQAAWLWLRGSCQGRRCVNSDNTPNKCLAPCVYLNQRPKDNEISNRLSSKYCRRGICVMKVRLQTGGHVCPITWPIKFRRQPPCLHGVKKYWQNHCQFIVPRKKIQELSTKFDPSLSLVRSLGSSHLSDSNIHWEHYNEVIMDVMASQITSLTIVYSTVYSGADQRKHQAPGHWPLCGEFTGDRWITRTNGQ